MTAVSQLKEALGIEGLRVACDDRLRSVTGREVTRSQRLYAVSRCGQFAALIDGDERNYFSAEGAEKPGKQAFEKMIEVAYINLPVGRFAKNDEDDRFSLRFEAKPVFPLHALGEVLGGAAAEISAAIKAPEELAAHSIMAVASFAAQRIWNVRHPETGADLPVSLFILSIANSGDRKTACDRMATRVLVDYQRVLHANYKAEYAQYREKLDDGQKDTEAPRDALIICQEPTLEGLQKSFETGQPSQALLNDEAGGFFGGHAMKRENITKTISGLTKFWDGSDIIRTRVSENVLLTNRRLSVHLLTQPIIADSVLRDPLLQHQGILARFLVAPIESIAGTRFIDRQAKRPSSEARERFYQMTSDMLQANPKMDETGGLHLPSLELNDDAWEVWEMFYNECEASQAPGGAFEQIVPFASKAGEHVLRLAAIFSAYDGEKEITLDATRRAVLLANFYLNCALRYTQEVEASESELSALLLVEWMESKGGEVTIKEINEGSPRSLGLRKLSRRAIRSRMASHSELGLMRASAEDSRGQVSAWEVVSANTANNQAD